MTPSMGTPHDDGGGDKSASKLNRDFVQKLSQLIQQVPHMDLSATFQRYRDDYQAITGDKHAVASETAAMTSTGGDQQSQDESSEANRLESLLSSVLSGITRHDEKPSKHYISWHQYFMSVAQLAAKRSKDPSTQVGACVVNQQNKIVATGYNGMPNGVRDDLVPWTKEGAFMDTKYAYVVHAELNAILNCVSTDLTGCRVYVSLFPCNECAKALIQSGVRLVIYLSDKHRDKDATKAAKRMFQMAGVLYRQYSSVLAADTLSGSPNKTTHPLR